MYNAESAKQQLVCVSLSFKSGQKIYFTPQRKGKKEALTRDWEELEVNQKCCSQLWTEITTYPNSRSASAQSFDLGLQQCL